MCDGEDGVCGKRSRDEAVVQETRRVTASMTDRCMKHLLDVLKRLAWCMHSQHGQLPGCRC